MLGNRITTIRLVLATAAIGVMAVLFAVVRWSSHTPAPTSAALQDQSTGATASAASRTYRVLHIMSYHSPWEWTDSQFNGFKDALQDVNVQYKVYEMDAQRQSSKSHLEQSGAEARWLIDDWKPDLVFISNDAGCQYVAAHYLNTNLPFIFSAMNAAPEDYGFDTAKNVTGVLEREHFAQTIRLLRQLVPEVRKIAIISDSAPMWGPVIARMKESESELDGVEVVSYDIVKTFEEYKTLVKSYEGKVDALGFLGISEFKDADDNNVPYQEVCRWTAENSKLPDFSFWVDRVDYGTLCAVTVSGYAQGQEAGKIARGILLDGRSPSSFPMLPTVRGEPIINLARARQFGLTPSSDVLLTAKVFTKYKWEN